VAKKAKKAKKGASASEKALFELHPLSDANPVTLFMCFHTPDDDIFIKCDWNPDERRFNRNCRKVGRDECIGGV
jgi:hypothetical protein